MFFQRSFFEEGSVARNGIWLAAEKIILLGKGVLLAYFLANWLNQDVYGTYQYVLACLGALSALLLPGMGVAVVQAIARNKGGTFVTALRKVFQLALWGAIILVLIGCYYLFIDSRVVAYLFFTLAAVFPGYSIMNFWRYYYTGYSLFGDLVRVSIILELLSFGFMILALVFFRNLEGLVVLGIIAPIPFSLFVVWRLFQTSRNLPSDDDAIVFGRRISYALSLSAIATYGDKLILGSLLGFVEVAIYAVAMIVPEQAKSIVASFMIPLLPKYSASVSSQELKKHLIISTFSSIGIAVVLYFLMPIVFSILFPKYLIGIKYAQWLLLVLCLLPATLLETYFRSQKDDVTVMKATVAGSLSSIALVASLVPFFGIMGAVGAKIGGLSVQSLVYFWSYIGWMKNSPKKILTD